MRRILDWGRTLLTLHGSVRGIAFGFTLGLALSLVPIPIAGMAVALLLAPLLRASPAATYLGSAVVNPLTAPGLYFAELWIGTRLLGWPVPSWRELAELDGWGWWGLFRELLVPFGVGAAVTIAAACVLVYPTVSVLVARWRSRSGSRSRSHSHSHSHSHSTVLSGTADTDQDTEADHHREHVGTTLAEKRQR